MLPDYVSPMEVGGGVKELAARRELKGRLYSARHMVGAAAANI